jgi:hypothetical protein
VGGEIFRTCPDRPWGLTSLLHSGYRISFPGVQQLGHGIDHPLPSSYEVKERVELYLYSPSGPSDRLKFTFTLPQTVRIFPHGNTTSVFQQETFNLVETADGIWMGSCHMDQSVKLRQEFNSYVYELYLVNIRALTTLFCMKIGRMHCIH